MDRNRFQFLVVRLKGDCRTSQTAVRCISIPCGSIKSIVGLTLRKGLLISIPCGSIKSAEVFQKMRNSYKFQFLVVRLKAILAGELD